MTREIYLEGVDFPLLLIKQVFVHEDGSTGMRYTRALQMAFEALREFQPVRLGA